MTARQVELQSELAKFATRKNALLARAVELEAQVQADAIARAQTLAEGGAYEASKATSHASELQATRDAIALLDAQIGPKEQEFAEVEEQRVRDALRSIAVEANDRAVAAQGALVDAVHTLLPQIVKLDKALQAAIDDARRKHEAIEQGYALNRYPSAAFANIVFAIRSLAD